MKINWFLLCYFCFLPIYLSIYSHLATGSNLTHSQQYYGLDFSYWKQTLEFNLKAAKVSADYKKGRMDYNGYKWVFMCA